MNVADTTNWYLCDTCAVPHYGMAHMLFGCEAHTSLTVKPTAWSGCDTKRLCKRYVPKEDDDGVLAQDG